MRTTRLAAILPVLLLCAVPAGAQSRAPAAPRTAPTTPAAAPATSPATPTQSVPATPQQTTASFLDWTLRCSRIGPAPGTQYCEIAQGIQRDDKPVAQLAIGRPARGQPIQLTVLVPINIAIPTPPTVTGGRDGEPVLELTWRRCLPGGCVADVPLPEEALTRMRSWADAGRITFNDALGRPAVLPMSPRGLAQALDALAKEEGG